MVQKNVEKKCKIKYNIINGDYMTNVKRKVIAKEIEEFKKYYPNYKKAMSVLKEE